MKLQRRQSPERLKPQPRLRAGEFFQHGQESARVDHLPRMRTGVVERNMSHIQELLSVADEDFDEIYADQLLFRVNQRAQLGVLFPEAVEPLADGELDVARKKIELFLLKLNGTLAEARVSLKKSKILYFLPELLLNLALYKSCFGDKGSTDLLSNEMLDYFLTNYEWEELLPLVILRPDQRPRIETQVLIYAGRLGDEYRLAEHSADDPKFYKEFFNRLADFILVFPDRRSDFPLNESDWAKIQQMLTLSSDRDYVSVLLKAAILNAEDAKIDAQGVIHLSRRKAPIGQQAKLPDRLHA